MVQICCRGVRTARRVLVVGPLLETGGISSFVGGLLSADIGYEIEHFDTKRPAKPHTAKGAVGYRTIFAAGFLWFLRNALITGWNIARFPFQILVSRPALVHIATSSHWSFWESAVYLRWSRLLGRKVLLHFLGDFQKFQQSSGFRERRLIARILRDADRVIVLSEHTLQIVAGQVPVENIIVVPSSVEVPSEGLLLAGPRSSNGARILFMGGNYGIRKGVNDLVDVIPQVLARHSFARFWLCGGGDVQRAYDRLQKSNAGKAVRYFGLVDETTKNRLFCDADVFVLPSHSEGMPYAIIEAMAAGLPVIATTVGAIPEVVIHRENGLLISPGDTTALLDSISTLVENPALRNKMSLANRERVTSMYSSERAFDTICRTYNDLLGAEA